MLKNLSFVFILLPLNLLAQAFTLTADLHFQNFNKQSNYINQYIIDMIVDKSGYVWTCGSGVQRFDGFKTIEYNKFSPSNAPLRIAYSGNLLADRSGRVWVGSGGLCFFDQSINGFRYIDPDPKHILSYAYAFNLQKNYLWFVCNYGLAKIDLGSLKISFTSLTDVHDPICTYQYDDNTLWITNREKLYKYNIAKNTYTSHIFVYQHKPVKILNIVHGGNARFLATNIGVFTITDGDRLTKIETGTGDNWINDISFLPQDKEKKYLLIATDGQGLLVYNTQLKKVEFRYLHDNDNPHSIIDNTISKIFVDDKNVIWIGTSAGISMLDNNSQQCQLRFLNKDQNQVVDFSRIAQDRFDPSKVWMAGGYLGMVRIGWKDKKVEKIYGKIADLEKIRDFEQVDKNKWILVKANKIILWDKARGTTEQAGISLPDTVSTRISLANIIRVNDTCYYITTTKGLFKYNLLKRKVTPVVFNKDYDLTHDLGNGFYENGVLWITSRTGIFNFNPSTNKFVIYKGVESSNHVYWQIANSGSDKIVCATTLGLTVFSKSKGTFEHIKRIANIDRPESSAVGIVGQTVWLFSYSGLLRYDLVNKTSEKLSFNMRGHIYCTSPFTVIGDEMAIGMNNGYTYFKQSARDVNVPITPVIENVFVNNLVTPTSPLSLRSGEKELELSYDRNSINIYFTSLFFNDPQNVAFRYRLKGTSEGWQYTTDQRNANYASLAPGSYVFMLQCNKGTGIWDNNNITLFPFVISPPFWRTWWFILLTAVCLSVAGYQLYRYRIAQIVELANVRNKIASDLHDDIGSALSSISIFSEVADQQLQQQAPSEKTREIIGRISFNARAMLEAMDDIVWAVNPQNDHFNDLAVRMREFAIPLLEARNIIFDINIQEGIHDTRVSMASRKNIFLIFKECINNILKHSCCTAMKVSVRKVNDQIEFVISDNGKGFDVDARHNRNGSRNMQKRAAEINGQLMVETAPGKGTLIKLLINII